MSSAFGKINTRSFAIVKVPSTLPRMQRTTPGRSISSAGITGSEASGRMGVRVDEDSHGRERVRHVDQGTDTRQAGSMLTADRTRTTSHAGVKGEFVGKHVPPDET